MRELNELPIEILKIHNTYFKKKPMEFEFIENFRISYDIQKNIYINHPLTSNVSSQFLNHKKFRTDYDNNMNKIYNKNPIDYHMESISFV